MSKDNIDTVFYIELEVILPEDVDEVQDLLLDIISKDFVLREIEHQIGALFSALTLRQIKVYAWMKESD